MDIAGNPVTVNGNPTYQEIDYDASFAAAETAGTPMSADQTHTLISYSANYGSDGTAATGRMAAKAHRDIIDSARFARTLYQTPIAIDTEPDAIYGCCVII